MQASQEILTLTTPKDGDVLTTPQQKGLLSMCEATIRTNLEGYYAVGVALATIRDQTLYKLDGFKTFDEYCAARWSFGRARACQLIKAAEVVTTVNNCKQPGLSPPVNEAQARELAKLNPEQQVTVWKKVVEKMPVEKVTAKVVAKAVASTLTRKAKKQPPKKPDKPDNNRKLLGDGDQAACSAELIAGVENFATGVQKALSTILRKKEVVALPENHELMVLLRKLESTAAQIIDWAVSAEADSDEDDDEEADGTSDADADDANADEIDAPAQAEADEEEIWTV